MSHDAVGVPEAASGLTRRDALRGAGASLAVLMTPALLSACGSSDDEGGSAPALRGRAISGQSLAATTFDPHTASTLGALTTIATVYEGLYGKSPQPPYDLGPQLAAGAPEQLSPTRVRVRLRAGARFHDGSPVTASDVEASFARILDARTASLLAGFLALVKRVRADGENAVVIDLTSPTTLLQDRLALVKVIPASLAKERGGAAVFNKQPVGSGPYKVASISSDLRTVHLDRFDGYNGPSKARLAQVGFDVVADDQARVAALQTKRLQAMTDPPFSAVAQLSKQSGIDAAGTPSFQQSLMMLHCGKPPFDDVRVRQALFLAIDRDAITQSVFFGEAEAATSYLPSGNPDYKQPATSLAYDPERARSLLRAAGADGLSFQLLVSNLGWLSAQAPLIQSQLKEVGVNASIKQGETESLVGEILRGNYAAWLTVTDPTAFGNDDAQFVIQWIYGNLAAAFLYWTTPAARRLQSLLGDALTSDSADQVAQINGELQDLIAAEAPAFPLHHRHATAAWTEGLDLTVDPVYGVDFRQAKAAA